MPPAKRTPYRRGRSDTPRLRLRAFSYHRLLGGRSAEIELDSDRPTVLTGANGTGKSTILRMISAMANFNTTILANAPVSEFRLMFDGAPDLVYRARREGHKQLIWGSQEPCEIRDEDFLKNLPVWAGELLEGFDGDRHDALEYLMDMGNSYGISTTELRRVRSVVMRGDQNGPDGELLTWIKDLREQLAVLYVSDQRIVSAAGSRQNHYYRSGVRKATSLAVENASKSIGDRIAAAATEYGSFSQILDRQLPNELIAALEAGASTIDQDGIERLLERTEVRRGVLSEVGLLDSQRSQPVNVSIDSLADEATRRVVQAVLESNMAKFSILDDLEERLSAFKSFLDDRLSPKRVAVDRESGLKFALPSGASVQPRQLSSGEQQITVLAYEILFNTSRGATVLIDEPELSLHVLWQDTLLADFMRMGAAADVRFLLATHSPAILAGAPALERSLDIQQGGSAWH